MTNPPKMGLIAGWGRYPVVLTETLKRQGCQVYCLGAKHHASPELAELADVYQEIGLAKLGAAIRFFRRYGVTRVTMAGKIHKVLIFQRRAWLKHLPDWRFFREIIVPHWILRRRDGKDDTLILSVIKAFARDGITFAPATDFVPEILVKPGLLAGRRLSHRERKDIEFGWNLAKEMGRLDVGQSVAVHAQSVMAVEAIEGTDECIRRAGNLCQAGGFTVVKVAKPQQDMRFDVPTIGLGTVQTLAEAGGRVLAIEADKTIVIDEPRVIDFAKRNGICLVALRDGESAENTPDARKADAA
jgi:DUF1009 family protein